MAFVEDSADSVVAGDAEVVEVDDVVGEWAKRCGLAEGSFRRPGPNSPGLTLSMRRLLGRRGVRQWCRPTPTGTYPRRMYLDLITIIVDDYDPAIAFFTEVLGFELAEDSPSMTNDGRPKRWVVVRPPGGGSGLLLARADGPEQAEAVGNQAAGRVGFFLRVDDFDAAHARMKAAGVEFVTVPRDEPYGRIAVFRDLAGNRWDLLGPE